MQNRSLLMDFVISVKMIIIFLNTVTGLQDYHWHRPRMSHFDEQITWEITCITESAIVLQDAYCT